MTASTRRAKRGERVGGGSRSFAGSRATTGNSGGFRFEKAFFKAAPEFDSAGAVRVDLIGPGKALLSVAMSPETDAEEDPVIGAWLSFIEADIIAHPERLVSVTEAEMSGYEKIVDGVVVTDEDVIPDDVTF